MRQLHQDSPGLHVHAQLLLELALERLRVTFAGCDLAAGELPAARHVLARRPLCDEHAALAIEQRRGHDSHEAAVTRCSTSAP